MTLSQKLGASISDNFLSNIFKKNNLVAAPMAGVSTSAFRLALRDFFDGLIFTEMVSVEGLIRAGKKTLQYIELTEKDSPVALQLFGSKAESFYDAARVCDDETNANIYDINMGCPVKKVLKSGSGAALLKDIDNIQNIIKSVRKATDKPITVKIRLGWDRNSINYSEIIKIAENEGVNAVSIHGRTKTEMFSGEIDYVMLADAVSKSSIPIIANGNVFDYKSYLKLKETGASGIMIGRGMMKTPWIFKAIQEGKDPENYLKPSETHALILRMISYEARFREEKYYTDAIKKYAVWFTKGLPESTSFRGDVYSSKTLNQLKGTMDKYFSDLSKIN